MILILSSFIEYTHTHFFTQTVTTLNLSFNQVGDKGAQHIADALRNNTVTLMLSSSIEYTHRHFFIQTLTTLYLYNNQIGDKLTRAVQELIERNKRQEK